MNETSLRNLGMTVTKIVQLFAMKLSKYTQGAEYNYVGIQYEFILELFK